MRRGGGPGLELHGLDPRRLAGDHDGWNDGRLLMDLPADPDAAGRLRLSVQNDDVRGLRVDRHDHLVHTGALEVVDPTDVGCRPAADRGDDALAHFRPVAVDQQHGIAHRESPILCPPSMTTGHAVELMRRPRRVGREPNPDGNDASARIFRRLVSRHSGRKRAW